MARRWEKGTVCILFSRNDANSEAALVRSLLFLFIWKHFCFPFASEREKVSVCGGDSRIYDFEVGSIRNDFSGFVRRGT